MNEQLLKGILKEIEIGLICLDAKDRLAGFSKTGARIYNEFLGIKLAEDMIGQHIDDCHPCAIRDKLHDELELVRGGKVKSEVSCKNGICWICQIKGIFDQEGAYLVMMEIHVPAGLLPELGEGNSK